ncbi:MAG: SUMF1/EgtB/PvdO family nonheme iron enzyme [Panacibacter sp.]
MKYFAVTLAIFLHGFYTIAQSTEEQKKFTAYTATIPESAVIFKMLPVPAGDFMMGSNEKDKAHKPNEGPQQKVNISAFWMGEHEVTFDEFVLYYEDAAISVNSDVDAVTRPTPQYIDFSLGMGKQGGFPVNSLSQHSALMYCKWLYNKTGVFYRLPTEAEWEYACRAGTSNSFYPGNDSVQLQQYAWFAANSENKYHKVMLKQPNAWGLYDMLGNVSEWTLDQYDENYFKTIASNATDPLIPPASRYPKTIRGGGYDDTAVMLRCAARNKSDASWNRRDPQIPKSKWWLTNAASVGFRIVRPVKQPTVEEAEAFYKNY